MLTINCNIFKTVTWTSYGKQSWRQLLNRLLKALTNWHFFKQAHFFLKCKALLLTYQWNHPWFQSIWERLENKNKNDKWSVSEAAVQNHVVRGEQEKKENSTVERHCRNSLINVTQAVFAFVKDLATKKENNLPVRRNLQRLHLFH